MKYDREFRKGTIRIVHVTPLAHAIPDDGAPYAAVVLNNLGGNKMDYYGRCRSQGVGA